MTATLAELRERGEGARASARASIALVAEAVLALSETIERSMRARYERIVRLVP